MTTTDASERELAGLETATLEAMPRAGEGDAPCRRPAELSSSPRHE